MQKPVIIWSKDLATLYKDNWLLHQSHFDIYE